MADQRITIGIGTTFSGEGVQKALKITQQLSGAVTRSAGIVSAMAGVMGDLDTSSAKCMTAVAGFMQALSTGNPVVIGTTVAMIALSKILGDQKEKLDALKAAADELKKSVDAAFDKALNNSLASAQKEAAALVADFDRITKSANAFTSALRGVQGANGKGSVIQLQTQKLNAMIAAQADGGEALVAAEYDLLIAKEKAAQAQNAATADLEAAAKAAADNATRTAKLEQARDKLIEEQSHLEATLMNSDGGSRQKVKAAIEKIVAEQERYSQQIADALDAQSVLDANVAKAKGEVANAERQAALDTLTAQNNIDKIRKAENDARQKQRAQLERANRRAELQEEADEERLRKSKKIATLEEKIAAAKQAAAQWEENAARARGQSFGDWNRGERGRAKDQRTADSRQKNRERSVDQEIARLEGMGEKARGKWGNDRLEKLREWKEAQNPANNKAANDVEAMQKEAADVAKKSEQHLAQIAKQMQNLGL